MASLFATQTFELNYAENCYLTDASMRPFLIFVDIPYVDFSNSRIFNKISKKNKVTQF